MNILKEKFKSEIPGTATQTSPLSTFRYIQRELQPRLWFSLAFLLLSNYNFPRQRKILKPSIPKDAPKTGLLKLVAHGESSSLGGTPAHIFLASLFYFNFNLLFIFSCYS